MAFGKLDAKFTARVEERFLVLEDLAEKYQCMSITNDAEAVVEWCVKNLAGWDRLIYRDTMGQWDEIVVKKQQFTGFRHIGGKDMKEALNLAVKLGPHTPKEILTN